MSQEQLALDSGVDRTFVSLLELGLRQPSLTTIFALASGLGCRPSDLVIKVERWIKEHPEKTSKLNRSDRRG